MGMWFGAAALGMIQSIRYNKEQKEARRGRQDARREAGWEPVPPRDFNHARFPQPSAAQRAATVQRIRAERRRGRVLLTIKVALAFAALTGLGYAYYVYGAAVCLVC